MRDHLLACLVYCAPLSAPHAAPDEASVSKAIFCPNNTAAASWFPHPKEPDVPAITTYTKSNFNGCRNTQAHGSRKEND